MPTETKRRSVRIPPAFVGRLDALAKQRRCSRAAVVAEMLAAYFDLHRRQLEAAGHNVDDLYADEPELDQAEVEASVRSPGTPNELPRPR
jgi:predicted transcriptional regulator